MKIRYTPKHTVVIDRIDDEIIGRAEGEGGKSRVLKVTPERCYQLIDGEWKDAHDRGTICREDCSTQLDYIVCFFIDALINPLTDDYICPISEVKEFALLDVYTTDLLEGKSADWFPQEGIIANDMYNDLTLVMFENWRDYRTYMSKDYNEEKLKVPYKSWRYTNSSIKNREVKFE